MLIKKTRKETDPALKIVESKIEKMANEILEIHNDNSDIGEKKKKIEEGLKTQREELEDEI